MNNKNIIKIIIFILLVLIFVVFFLKKRSFRVKNKNLKEERSLVSLQNQNESAEVIAQNVTLKEFSSKGSTGWQIFSKIAKFFKSESNIECKDVLCELITKNSVAAFLNSEKVIVNTKSKDIFLEGSVTGSYNNLSLLGSDFLYNFNKHLVFSNSKINLEHPLFKFSSEKVSVDLKEKEITFLGKVKSEFNISGLQLQQLGN